MSPAKLTDAPYHARTARRLMLSAAVHLCGSSENALIRYSKAKSVILTEEGLKRAEDLFQTMFTNPD